MECDVSQACMAQTDMEPMRSQTVTNVLCRENGVFRVSSRGTDLLLLPDLQNWPFSENGVAQDPFLSDSANYYPRCSSEG